MEIIEGLIKAFELIISGDVMVVEITARSVLVSGSAILLSALWSFPLASILGLYKFTGRFILKGVFNALMGMPTVTLGLVLYLFLSKSGPLGFLSLLYDSAGIAVGQAILVTPIMVSFIASAIESVSPEIKDLAKTLGASEFETSVAVLRESLSGVVLAITASFNRAIAELGIALMVGGNISGYTSVLTTTIALETNKGNIALGIALAIILLLIVSTISLSVNMVQRHRT